MLISSYAAIKSPENVGAPVEALTSEQREDNEMADDRMKHDDQKNMGGADKGQNYGGQKSPGRAGESGKDAGQHAGGQQGQVGGQKGSRNMEDDEEDFGAGKSGQAGTQNRGTQNRSGQNR